ncbi:MAG: hypothetical protein NXH75_16030, partial [Halobacteriovoraceae bacterium]|nr:hypothetical protein [Halobacteriovoraceae bacterium]
MKISLALIFLVLSSTSNAVIYGDNTVIESNHIQNREVFNQAKAVAGVFQYFVSPENSLQRFGAGRRLTHKTVCEEEKFSNQPIESVATAFLIDKNHLLTVGHAVGSQQNCIEKVFFSFNYEWVGEKVKDLSLKDLYFCKRIVKSQYSGIDFAIIELD